MKFTKHVHDRMNKRGITKDMIDFVLNFGEVNGDSWYVNRKELQKLIRNLEYEMKIAKKLLDKGGIVVVAESETILTTYDIDSANFSY